MKLSHTYAVAFPSTCTKEPRDWRRLCRKLSCFSLSSTIRTLRGRWRECTHCVIVLVSADDNDPQITICRNIHQQQICSLGLLTPIMSEFYNCTFNWLTANSILELQLLSDFNWSIFCPHQRLWRSVKAIPWKNIELHNLYYPDNLSLLIHHMNKWVRSFLATLQHKQGNSVPLKVWTITGKKRYYNNNKSIKWW